MRYIHTAMLLSAFLFAGCEKNAVAPTQEDSSGNFAFTRLQGLGSNTMQEEALRTARIVQRSIGKVQVSGIDLGTIKNTTDFYFILTNVGHKNITDITLTSSNPKFLISPTFIDTLPPVESATLTTIVKITAVHGTAPSRVGYADLMSPGLNIDSVLINGRTKNNDNQNHDISFQAQLSLNAFLAAVKIMDGANEVDLKNPNGQTTLAAFPNITCTVYRLKNPLCTIENTGNVTLQLQSFTSEGVFLYNRTLEPTQSDTLQVFSIAMIGTGGTITDQKRLRLSNDGNVYLYFGN